MLAQYAGDPLERPSDGAADDLGVVDGAQGRRSDDVGEQDRDELAFLDHGGSLGSGPSTDACLAPRTRGGLQVSSEKGGRSGTAGRSDPWRSGATTTARASSSTHSSSPSSPSRSSSRWSSFVASSRPCS